MMKKSRKVVMNIMVASMCLMLAVPAYAWSWRGEKKEVYSETEKTEYTFTYRDMEIRVNMEAEPVLTALGKAVKIFEQQSCAYQGMDRIYTYPGVEIGTYPVNGKEIINSIYFIDDTVSTQENIRFGSTCDDMVNAYGKDYTEEFGVYRYVLGTTELNIYTTDKIVDGIEYQLKTEN